MKHNKNVIMKCSKCNKPFKAYGPTDTPICAACKKVEDEERLRDSGIVTKKRMVRTESDVRYNLVAPLVAISEKEAKKRDHDEEIAETIVCKECGEEFSITNGEKEWYLKRNLAIPTRCLLCRCRRKREAQKNEQ